MTPRAQASLAGLGTVLIADRLGLTRTPIRAISGLFDEMSHLATGMVVLAAGPRRSGEFEAGLAAGSVLLDIDHIPEAIGIRVLRARRTRPVPHSIGTLLAMRYVARSGRVSRELMAGATLGVVSHLARDLATGTNAVPLLWPFSRRGFSAPYGLYAAALAALAGVGLAESRSKGISRAPS